MCDWTFIRCLGLNPYQLRQHHHPIICSLQIIYHVPAACCYGLLLVSVVQCCNTENLTIAEKRTHCLRHVWCLGGHYCTWISAFTKKVLSYSLALTSHHRLLSQPEGTLEYAEIRSVVCLDIIVLSHRKDSIAIIQRIYTKYLSGKQSLFLLAKLPVLTGKTLSFFWQGLISSPRVTKMTVKYLVNKHVLRSGTVTAN